MNVSTSTSTVRNTSVNGDTPKRKNADMPSIDFTGAGVIFRFKCIPGRATVAGSRVNLQYRTPKI